MRNSRQGEMKQITAVTTPPAFNSMIKPLHLKSLQLGSLFGRCRMARRGPPSEGLKVLARWIVWGGAFPGLRSPLGARFTLGCPLGAPLALRKCGRGKPLLASWNRRSTDRRSFSEAGLRSSEHRASSIQHPASSIQALTSRISGRGRWLLPGFPCCRCRTRCP
jgi:hypothetical protein